jgi:hypothetical protein
MPATSTRRLIAVVAAGAISTLAFAGTAMAHKGSSWHPHPGAAYSSWADDNGLKGASAKWNKDNDRDGLKNWGEFRSGTNPKDRDSDDDRTSDAYEDRDRDGLTNVIEYKLRTNPKKSDSLKSIDSGEIEVKGIVEAFTAPTETQDGVLKIKVAGTPPSTLVLPKGATVIGKAVLEQKGAYVEVEIEREDGITIVKAHIEDSPGVGGTGTTSTGTSSVEDSSTGTTTDDTTNGTSTSGKNKGGGGDD